MTATSFADLRAQVEAKMHIMGCKQHFCRNYR